MKSTKYWLFLIGFLLLYGGWLPPEKAQESLKDWINGPVRIIALSSEKKLFKRLKTDAERRKFIEIFWKRRDPNPETSENEFKKEFEERVEYANLHFIERGLKGWETARGQIYILFGPPSREWRENLVGVPRLAYFWYYDNPPTSYLRWDEALVFADIFNNRRYYLLRPFPRDIFDLYFYRQTPRSMIDLIPVEYFRPMEDVREKLIVRRDIDYSELTGKREGISVSAIPFDLSYHLTGRKNKRGEEVLVTIGINYTDFTYYQEKGLLKAKLKLTLEVRTEKGKLVEKRDKEVELSLMKNELLQRSKSKYEERITIYLPPGGYYLTAKLEDKRTGAKGVKEQFVDIPPEEEAYQ